jgi:hypothetical protein
MRSITVNISDYSYYRLYREAEARMEKELEARRISLERAHPRESRRPLQRVAAWVGARFERAPRHIARRAGSHS